MQSLIQSLITIVETVLHYVDFPLGGVVTLGGLWYKVFQQHSQRVSHYIYGWVGERGRCERVSHLYLCVCVCVCVGGGLM